MTEIIDYLKPFAIKVIENNGKLNPHEFILHLEKEYIQAGGDNEWFSENKEKISIKSSRLIDTALTEWLKKQYNSYPHKTRRDETSVICGKVSELENVSASSMYSYSTENGWSLWQTTGMESGKKLQIIHLQDETEPYYVVWTKDAIGIRVYNIIDFQWETKNNFRIILKKSLEGHGIGFGGSKPALSR